MIRGAMAAPYADIKVSFNGNLNTDSYFDGIIHKLKHFKLLHYFSAKFVPLHETKFYIMHLKNMEKKKTDR